MFISVSINLRLVHTESYGAGDFDVWLIKTDEHGTKITSDPPGFDNSGKQNLAINAYSGPAHSGCYIQLSPAIKSKMNGNQKVSLRVYSTQGRMVQEINAGSILDNNTDSFHWDGIDSKGNKLTPGCYLVGLFVSDKVLASTKIFLTR